MKFSIGSRMSFQIMNILGTVIDVFVNNQQTKIYISTGRAQLIQSHLSARISFELS